jgi:uncharacterized protein YihD (DUF1040 family)
MRDPRRISHLLDALKEAWEKHPDLRLGQLIVSVTPCDFGNDPFYVEDDDMLIALRAFANPTAE